jgi:hypothetical protein
MSRSKRNEQKATVALVHLSSAEMRHLPKPRKGFEPYVQRLAALVDGNASVAQAAGVDVSAMLEELDEYEAAHSAALSLSNQLKLAQQTEFLHAANVWSFELRIYRVAKALGVDDQDIQNALADFEAFLKKARKKKAAATTASTTPSAT